MIEILRPNRIDLIVGLLSGLVYAATAPSNEIALALSPIVTVVTPYVGKVVHRAIFLLLRGNVDRGPNGYYGLISDHAKSGIQQINVLEEEGLLSPEQAEKNRRIYAKRHAGH